MFSLFSSLPASLQPSPPLSEAAWQSELIAEVLSISVDKHKSGKAGRTFLAEAAKEAALAAASSPSAGEQRLLSLEQLDSLLIERLSLPLAPHANGLSFLLSCYRRLVDVYASLNHVHANLPGSFAASLPSPVFLTTARDVTTGIETCEALLSRLIAYCCMVLTDDEPLSGPVSSSAPQTVKDLNQQELLRLLYSDPQLSRALPPHFLEHVCRYTEAEQLWEAFNPIITQCGVLTALPASQASMSPFEVAKEKVQALLTLARQPALASLITRHSSFIPRPPQTGRSFQLASLLGHHLGHFVSQSEPEFVGVLSRTQQAVDDDTSRLRAQYAAYHDRLSELFRCLIRDADNRERVVLYFSQLLSLNASRRKSYYDPWQTADDPLFYNALIVLLRLSAPIVRKNDMQTVKLDFVVSKQSLLSYAGSTRVLASAAEVSKRSEEAMEASYNFSTQIFFLTQECMHLCQPLLRHAQQLQEKLAEQHSALRRIERGSEQSEQQLAQVRAAEEQLMTAYFSLNVHMLDPAFHSELLSFLDFTAHVLQHHITAGSSIVQFLPESILECMVDYYGFLGRYAPQVFPSLSSSLFTYLPSLLTTLAAGPHALRNPHLRAKLPTIILLLFVPPAHSPGRHPSASASLSYLLDSSEAFQTQLLPSLLDLYVEIEFGDRMFFPKFNVRYEITCVLEHLYTLAHYRRQLIRLAADLQRFLAFTNALANDLVFLLDEGLKALSNIRSAQAEQETEAYRQLPQQAREEKETEYKQAESMATSYLQLASSTIHFLSTLTQDVTEPFTTHRLDFVSRFATTLTYYIQKLVGRSVSELKVNNKEKYRFQPRLLLKEMVQVFLHLSSSAAFLEKVASDERSYSVELFDRAYWLMRRREILDPPDLRLFHSAKQQIAVIHANLVNFQQSIGDDIPDRFLDALMSSVMSDPVRLPRSKQVVDRVTIQRHLINSRTDPFNRSELKEEELIEEAELKEEIAQWMREKKAAWLEQLKREKEGKEEDEQEAEEGSADADMKDEVKDDDSML